MTLSLFQILVFSVFLFLSVMAMAFAFIDRKLCARMRNRIGSPWYQPLADLVKLASKETVIPAEASPGIFKAIPLFALASTASAFLYIPIWGAKSLYPFDCDLLVVLSALIAAIFLPALLPASPMLGFIVYLLKSLAVVFVLAVMKIAFARFHTDQMVRFCWRVLAPVSILQILIDIIAKEVILS